MKTPKMHKNPEKLHLKPNEKACEICGSKLIFWTWILRKYVVTLTNEIELKSEAMICSNEDCPNHKDKIYYASKEAHKLALKNSTFGLDVIAFIGFKRTQENKNFKEIHKELEEKGVVISRRNVDKLYKSFEYLLKCSLKNRLTELLPVFKKNGGVILSIDGLQPQQENDLLFVIRDVETQEVLHGCVLHYTDTNAMVELFQIIKDSGVKVKAIISDAQASIKKAVGIVFPDVPYQLCTFHYLKNMGKPVGEEDKKLKKELKKNFVD
jgi:hypothetical protein